MTNSSRTVPPSVSEKWPALHDAIWRACGSGDLTDLRKMLSMGAEITATSDSHAWTNATVLHTAADGDVALLELLLEYGAVDLIESRCGPGEEGRQSGLSVLQYAARHGRTEISQRLIEVGAEYDIFSAVALGDIGRVAQLVESDESSLTKTDDYHAPLLHWAAATDQEEVASFLSQRGADVEAQDDFGETALLVASVSRARSKRGEEELPNRTSLVDFLLDLGAKANVHTAAALGDHDSLSRLLDNEPSMVSSNNCHGTTPLHWAARNAHIDSAQLLIDRGAGIDAKDNIGCPPLFYAAYWGYDAAMTELLCKNGANVGFRNIWDKGLTSYDIGNENASIVANYRKS